MVDQTVSLPDGKHFRPIGTVDLKENTETVIPITNADTAGLVILDALRLLPIEPELRQNESISYSRRGGRVVVSVCDNWQGGRAV